MLWEFWAESPKQSHFGAALPGPQGCAQSPIPALQLWASCVGTCPVATLPSPHLQAGPEGSHLHLQGVTLTLEILTELKC